MENSIKHIIKTELKINDHLTFTHHFKKNLSQYRKNLTCLVQYLTQNKLIKKHNVNCNTIMDITPISNKKNNENKKQYLNTQQFYGR